MSQYTDAVSRAIETWREFARKNGWAEYIYTPYHPLIITDLYKKGLHVNTKEGSGH